MRFVPSPSESSNGSVILPPASAANSSFGAFGVSKSPVSSAIQIAFAVASDLHFAAIVTAKFLLAFPILFA